MTGGRSIAFASGLIAGAALFSLASWAAERWPILVAFAGIGLVVGCFLTANALSALAVHWPGDIRRARARAHARRFDLKKGNPHADR